MSTLNDTITDREVQHEWDLNVHDWELEHGTDDGVQELRAATMRMTAVDARYPFQRPTLHDQSLARLTEADDWDDYGYGEDMR